MSTNAAPFMGNALTSAVLAVLAVLLVGATLTGRTIPFLLNDRAALLMLVGLGMALCARGIGHVAAHGQWTHPLALLGMLLGALILTVAAPLLVGRPLPLISTPRHAILAVGLLSAVKLALSALHRLLA